MSEHEDAMTGGTGPARSNESSTSPSPSVPPVTPPAPPRAPAPVSALSGPLRAWLLALTAAVVLQLLITIVLAVGVFVYSTTFFGVPTGDEYMRAETIAADVGYYVSVGDVDGYMDLYAADDPHVARDRVRQEFEEVAGSFNATQTGAEFMSQQVVLYDDEETDEELARITVSAFDYETGRPVGRRLTIWALLGDECETVLTGAEGRDLSDGTSVW